MGLLDQLWDDTVAGPQPENGLGKLRKHHTFSFRPQISGKESTGDSMRPSGDDPKDGAVKVTRSITIVKPPGYSTSSPPASPAGSSTPGSPFSDIGRRLESGLSVSFPVVGLASDLSMDSDNEAESPSGLEGDLRRTRMRRQAKLDQKAPLLLKTTDI